VNHCPTGQIRKTRATGGLYRVRRAGAEVVEDPWGLRIDWRRIEPPALVALLGDRRPAVRDRAQATLAGHGKLAVKPLAAALAGPAAPSAKAHAVWALAAIDDEPARSVLRGLLRQSDPEVVATAARALALRGDRPSAPDLCRLLGAEGPALKMAAAEALARCGDARSLPALWETLAGQPDRFLEHALIHAAHRVADTPSLQAALRHPEARVQKAALLLLDQPPRPRGHLAAETVLARVTAADAGLRQTALRVLQGHPEWAEHALGVLRNWLEKPALSGEEQVGLRGLILAFQGRRAVQEAVASAIVGGDGNIPAERRVFLLETLAECSLP
jgi:hypothetical protein